MIAVFIYAISFMVCPFAFGAIASQKKGEKLYWGCINAMFKFEKENCHSGEHPIEFAKLSLEDSVITNERTAPHCRR